ncbi:MAG: MBL fold metallo-hydrolase [Lachnospiraceae bacterium]|nr:MBL fold metallo-hydrolase [Lachnospiraceae bacterium]
MNIIELHYSNTNTYLIKGGKGYLLFDTGWAGTFPAFCKSLGEAGVKLSDIKMVLISHYHPDHMGIAGEIAGKGPVLLACDIQKAFLHSSDHIFEKENRKDYVPIDDGRVRVISINESRNVLGEIGIDGEIIATPGHSDDSISLLLDSGELFVGDLNPLYELDLHKGTEIGSSWDRLLARKPKKVYYGHAKAYAFDEDISEIDTEKCDTVRAAVKTPAQSDSSGAEDLVSKIVKLIDKGYDINRICKKTHSDAEFVQDVMRMYLTHPGVSVQGILDRIEIKGR